MSEFVPVNPEDRIIYELMPLIVGIGPDENLLSYGSCFIASPHMAITAKHVIEELLKQDPAVLRGEPARYEYWVVQVAWENDRHRYVVWTIDTIATSPHSDIAIIWLRGWDENAAHYRAWKAAPMTLEPPEIGAEVRAFGLHNVRFDGSRVDQNGKFEHVEVKFDRSRSTGIVRQLYWSGRDRAMYNFPCFEVAAKSESGMSGGLVINDRSEVCGIVCGSLPASSPEEEDISYFTMLWPIMAIPVCARLVPGSDAQSRYRVRDLAARGIFAPKGWDNVVIEDDVANGGPVTLRYLLKQ